MSRHEIQILRAATMAQRAVAAATNISLRSVRRIEQEPPVTTSDTAALIAARRIGRPSIAAWAGVVEAWLREDPSLPGVEILRRLGEEHQYDGGKSAVYDLVRRLRPPAVVPPGSVRGGSRRVQPARFRASRRPLHLGRERTHPRLCQPAQAEPRRPRGRGAR